MTTPWGTPLNQRKLDSAPPVSQPAPALHPEIQNLSNGGPPLRFETLHNNQNTHLYQLSTMASLLKASEKIQADRAIKGNKGKKRAAEDEAGPSSSAVEKKRKDKVLMLSSRGITGRMRHLMLDLESLLPHVKKGTSNRLGLSVCWRTPLLMLASPLYLDFWHVVNVTIRHDSFGVGHLRAWTTRLWPFTRISTRL